MPTFEHAGATIYYEEHGQGFPLLLFAPGGMRSSIAFWQRAPFDPIREFSNEYRVIAFDQRNAGRSRAPIDAQDGWHSYAADHLALLDHLGIERCFALGGCIGGAFALRLCVSAPERVAAAVLQQPIGHSPQNRELFYELFDGWAKELAAQHPEASPAALRSFRENMYGGEFVFSVTREAVRALETPLLVLMGNDVYHPTDTSREICLLGRRTQLIERWKEPDVVPETVRKLRSFFAANRP